VRAVIQRVESARVDVSGSPVGEIADGLLVYLGIGKSDTAADRAYLLKKILGLRVFPNEKGKMDKSIVDVGGSLLVVSQFTLYGDVERGLRPSFDGAMEPGEAEKACEGFVFEAKKVIRVETGRFRAHMTVTSANVGPVTLILDSERRRDGGP
jgi:D-tyrosyl-tRNA(Tyr) deacylase